MQYTIDTPIPGLSLYQPKEGFRYTSDSYWLAGFSIENSPFPKNALDLGTGSGIIAFLLASRNIHTTGLDKYGDWIPFWEKTLANYTGTTPPRLIHCDVLDTTRFSTFDLIVSNPPYFASKNTFVSPNPWKATARTESNATLSDFLTTATKHMHDNSRICMSIPQNRTEELNQHALLKGLCLSRCYHIGHKRTLVEYTFQKSQPSVLQIQPSDPKLQQWYHLFRLS